MSSTDQAVLQSRQLAALIGVSALIAGVGCLAPQAYAIGAATCCHWWLPLVYLLFPIGLGCLAWVMAQRSGQACHAPVLTVASLVLFFATSALVSTEWAVDCSYYWCFWALGILLLSAACTAYAVLMLTQYWRCWAIVNKSIVDDVWRYLERHKFVDRAPSASADKIKWGSRHRLTVIEYHYQAKRSDLLRRIQKAYVKGSEFSQTQELIAFQNAARALIQYLNEMEWVESVLPAAEQQKQSAEALRDLIVTTLWFANQSPPPKDATSAQRWGDATPENVELWIGQCNQISPSASVTSEMIQLFRDCRTRIASRRGQTDVRDACCADWKKQWALFQRARTREFAETWLALSGAPTPRAKLDCWRMLSRCLPVVHGPWRVTDGTTLTGFLALTALLRTYREMNRGLHERQEDCLGRIQHLSDVLDNCKGELLKDVRLESAAHKSREVSSWAYREVWRNWRVAGALFTTAAFPLLVCGLTLALVCPRFPGRPQSWQTNTVVFNADRRWPVGNYTSGGPFNAMASGERNLFLAGTSTIVAVDRVNRIPREGRISSAAIDISCTEGDKAVALLRNQHLVGVEANLDNCLTPFCIQQPAVCWPGIKFTGPEFPILTCELEARGWLVASPLGIARYRTDIHMLSAERNWDVGDYSNAPLTHAVITNTHVVGAAQENGEALILFLNRQDLREARNLRQRVPGLTWLDADRALEWACAIDGQASLWAYSKDFGHWNGPWGQRPSGGLGSPDAVKLARYVSPVAWLATEKGLYAADEVARQIVNAQPDSRIQAIYPLTGDDGQARQAITSTGKGLFLVTVPLRSNPSLKCIDEQPILHSAASTDSRLCAFLLRPKGNSANVLRVARTTGSEPQCSTVIPEGGWYENLAEQVTGVQERGHRLFFTARTGALIYDELAHTYTDISKAMYAIPWAKKPPEPETRDVRNFGALVGGGPYLAALSGSQPLVLNRIDDQPLWRALDPEQRTFPRQLTLGQNQNQTAIFGRGSSGEIYRYSISADKEPISYLRGSSTLLPCTGMQTGFLRFQGDFWRNPAADNSWRLAFAAGASVVGYDSESGDLSEWKPPREAGLLSAVTQLVVASDAELYVTAAGQVVTANKSKAYSGFGLGALPFAPDRITAIAPSQQSRELFVAGPGKVCRYDWASGSWSNVAEFSAEVTALQTSSFGLLIRTEGDTHYVLDKNGLRVLDRIRRIAVDQKTVWTLTDTAVEKQCESALRSTFAEGREMKGFLDKTAFAWSPDTKNLFLFSNGSETAHYNAVTDTFETRSFPMLRRPELFLPLSTTADEGGRLAILDGQTVHLFDRSGTLSPLAQLPAGVKSCALQSNNGALSLAWITDAEIGLKVWPDERHSSRVNTYSRALCPAPRAFSPDRVVHAMECAEGVLLVDASGACVLYRDATNQWEERRASVATQNVVGWFRFPDPKSAFQASQFVLLLQSPGKNIVGVPIRSGRPQPDVQLPFARAEIALHLDEIAALLVPEMRPVEIRPAGTLSAEDAAEISARRHQALLDQLRPSLFMAGENGLLCQTKRFAVKRVDGTTRYSSLRDGSWCQFACGAGEFPFKVTGLTVDVNGELCVLHAGGGQILQPLAGENGLVPAREIALPALKATTGGILCSLEKTNATYRLNNGKLETHVLPRTASVNVAPPDLRLTCQERPPGGYALFWQGHPGDLPVWAASDGRLASQSISDIAVQGQTVLLATELGLIARNAETFAPKAVDARLKGARFVRLFGPEDIVIVAGGRAFRWTETGAVACVDPVFRSVVRSGPWDWELSYAVREKPKLRIFSGDWQRNWAKGTEGGWRFADDVVLSVQHDEGEICFGLNTRDGCWAFNPTSGRVALFDKVKRAAGRRDLDLKALRITACDGNIEFRSFDGQPVFSASRFFCDNTQALLVHDENVYAVVPGRCLVKRSIQRPAVILACWRAPEANTVPSVRYALSASGTRLRLEASDAVGAVRYAWELDPGVAQEKADWKKADIGTEPLVGTHGVVAWKHFHDVRDEWRPVIRAGPSGTPVPLQHWWPETRFSWDTVRAVGVPGPDAVAAATEAGAAVLALIGNGNYPLVALEPACGAQVVGETRRRGGPVGVVFGTADHSREWLLGRSADNVWALKENTGKTLICQAGVSLEQLECADIFYSHRIGFREDWKPVEFGNNSRVAAFQNRVARLSDASLFSDGRFIFDTFTAACALGPCGPNGRSRLWATLTAECNRTKFLCLNQLEPDGRLVPIGLLPISDATRALRAASSTRSVTFSESPALVTLAENKTTGWFAERVSFAASGPQLTRDDPSNEAFDAGWQVVLDVEKLSWAGKPLHLADRLSGERPFDCQPSARLENYGSGVAWNFDIFHAMALNPVSKDLVFSTRIGTRHYVYNPDFGKSTFRRIRIADARGAPDRIEFSGGALWGTWKSTAAVLSRNGWSPHARPSEDLDLAINLRNGLTEPLAALLKCRLSAGPDGNWRSNDLWSCHREVLSGLRGIVREPASNTLWLLGEKGLFKLTVRDTP